MLPISTAFVSLLSLLATLPFVYAHGFLSDVTIDGKTYKGNVPNQDTSPSPIRLIDDISPVKGANNKFLSCGQNATLASMVADANPGSTVAFSWNSGNGGHWPHNTGPIMTYMAACTGTTCDKFDASNAAWFKIDQAGQEQGNDTWVQADTFFLGKSYSLTLPQNIAPGDYLIRHEIIALHLATEEGGAEFYPSCTQVRISGSGTGVPDPSQEVSFPGAYSDNDPGIYDPDIYNPGSKYVYPGPQLVTLVASSSGGVAQQSSAATPSTPDPSTSTSASVQAPSATSSPASASTGSCKKKRMVKRNMRHAKRHLSGWF